MQQSSTARLAAVNEAISLPESLQDFNTFMFAYAEPEVKAWGNGAGFDNIILRSAYTACGAIPPWRYYNDRCYRTIKSMCPHVTLERKGTAHNALDDAESQAIHLIRILKCLNLK
jgi:exodeoxyribonuclease VIII